MKRVSLATLALVISAAACQDAVTSPQVGADINLRYVVSNPPPQRIDTGATGSFTPTGTTFSILVTYFFLSPEISNPDIPNPGIGNPDVDEGLLSMPRFATVGAALNAMVKYRHGDFSGQGTVKIQTANGLLVIDLSCVNDALSFFERCGGDARCFHLIFDHVKLYPIGGGDPIDGTAQMDPGPRPTTAPR